MLQFLQLLYNLNVIYIASPDLSGLATDPVVKEKIIEYMEKGVQDEEEGGTVLCTVFQKLIHSSLKLSDTYIIIFIICFLQKNFLV